MKWPHISLKSLAAFGPQYGANARAIKPTGNRPRYVRITDIGETGNLLSEDICQADLEDVSQYVLEENDLLFARSGATVGKTYLYRKEDGPCVFAGYLIRFRLNPCLVLPKYLFYYTRSQYYLNWVAAKKRVAAQPNVNGAEYGNLKIPLPPFSEQRQIVEILEQADALRKKRAEADAKAARILPALFYKMFGDPATNPKGRSKVTIRSLISDVERRNPSNQPDTPFVYIDIAGVDSTLGRIVEFKTLLGGEAPGRARQVIKTNDVLVSTVRPYLRATALVPSYLDNQICSTGFCVLRARSVEGFGFLYALTRLPWFTQRLNELARGASYPAVTDNDVLGLCVSYPSGNEAISAFDHLVLQFFMLQEYRLLSNKKIESLFLSLLQRAFSGDLTAKWPETHMKELLAEMEEQARLLQKSSNLN